MTKSQNSSSSLSYKDAGVNIDAGNELVDTIKPLAAATNRAGANPDLGGFGGLFDLKACNYKDPVLVSATDGVGTKLKLAFQTGIHESIGIDLVAMCVNDLIVQGAEPLFFLDYYATSKLEPSVAKSVIQGIAEGCQASGCALIGGETAEMPGMYQAGHYDLAGFAVGAVEREKILPSANIQEGQILLGLGSSGVHSNGFSLVHRLLESIENADSVEIDGQPLIEALLEPTILYVKPCLELIRSLSVYGLCHITGGGLLENIPRVLPSSIDAHIDAFSLEIPELFHWIKQTGNVDAKEMLRTFNMGVGMVAIIDPDSLDQAIAICDSFDIDAYQIGQLTKGSGSVHIDETQLNW